MFANGIQAKFDMVNAAGGIYGRKLVIGANRNDGFINNQLVVKESFARPDRASQAAFMGARRCPKSGR